jgi:thioredoxin 1
MGAAIIAVALLGGQWLLTRSSAPIQHSALIGSVTGEQQLDSIIAGAGSKLLVFDLYADWCGPCRTLSPRLEALATTYGGTVGFYRINVDANQAIASAFGTKGIPHVVFVKNGKAVTALTGLYPSEAYEKIITSYAEASGSSEKVLSSL